MGRLYNADGSRKMTTKRIEIGSTYEDVRDGSKWIVLQQISGETIHYGTRGYLIKKVKRGKEILKYVSKGIISNCYNKVVDK